MKKKKILVVDDEDDILQFLVLVLTDKGYQVTTAASGGAALAQARREPPDLVLLDIMMPQMDGWQVLKLLRLDEATAQVPVAMLSARADASDRVQGLQQGVTDYICKPFSLAELHATIEAILGPARERRAGQ
jgi:DNA-binding response OmpR family regulator